MLSMPDYPVYQEPIVVRRRRDQSRCYSRPRRCSSCDCESGPLLVDAEKEGEPVSQSYGIDTDLDIATRSGALGGSCETSTKGRSDQSATFAPRFTTAFFRPFRLSTLIQRIPTSSTASIGESEISKVASSSRTRQRRIL